jgi:hypothetical protein
MPVERCSECGLDGDDWTDAAVLDAVGELLPERFRTATAGLGQHDAVRRPLPATWSHRVPNRRAAAGSVDANSYGWVMATSDPDCDAG